MQYVYKDNERTGSLATFMVIAMVLMSVGFGALCFVNNNVDHHGKTPPPPVAKSLPVNG